MRKLYIINRQNTTTNQQELCNGFVGAVHEDTKSSHLLELGKGCIQEKETHRIKLMDLATRSLVTLDGDEKDISWELTPFPLSGLLFLLDVDNVLQNTHLPLQDILTFYKYSNLTSVPWLKDIPFSSPSMLGISVRTKLELQMELRHTLQRVRKVMHLPESTLSGLQKLLG